MQYRLKWTAVLMLVGVAGSIACSSSEPGEAQDRANESLGSVEPSRELHAPGAQTAATDDPDPSCGHYGQVCCGGSFGTCVDGSRCNEGYCSTPCGLPGELCCRDATGTGYCNSGSCVFFPPPTHCE